MMPLMSQQGNGHIYVQSTQPTGTVTGDLWIDSSTFAVQINNNGSFQSIINTTMPIAVSK